MKPEVDFGVEITFFKGDAVTTSSRQSRKTFGNYTEANKTYERLNKILDEMLAEVSARMDQEMKVESQ